MLVGVAKQTLNQANKQAEERLRARLLVALLTRLRYE